MAHADYLRITLVQPARLAGGLAVAHGARARLRRPRPGGWRARIRILRASALRCDQALAHASGTAWQLGHGPSVTTGGPLAGSAQRRIEPPRPHERARASGARSCP